jgi:hypothetical protein
MPGLKSFTSFDLGAVLTIGYSIPVGANQNIGIQLVDILGLKNINKDNPYGLSERNHTLYVVVSYALQ